MYDPENNIGGWNPLILAGVMIVGYGLFAGPEFGGAIPWWGYVLSVVSILIGLAWEIFKKLTIGMIYYNAAWRWDRRDK